MSPKSLSGEAVQFYKSGQPFLQHNLPFWMASLVGHLLVLLIPIVAVLYPMMRFLLLCHQLEKQANQLRMPIAYESMMYLLRNHIGVVRNRLAAGQP